MVNRMAAAYCLAEKMPSEDSECSPEPGAISTMAQKLSPACKEEPERPIAVASVLERMTGPLAATMYACVIGLGLQRMPVIGLGL